MNENIRLNDKRIAILTLGCKVNAYESDAMAELLSQSGAKIVDFEDDADVYIVNTCSVTNIADRKSRQMLNRPGKRHENAVVIAAGCYIQALSEDERKALGYDAYIGNNRKEDVVRIVYDALIGKHPDVVPDLSQKTEYEDLQINGTREHTRAYIKIQDGCDQFCSYCIIPYTRGRIRSRAPEDVVSEAERLSAAGYSEIVLTGIHVSSYEAHGEKGGKALLTLLSELQKVEGLARIRLSSLEPRIITEDFVKEICRLDKVCPQFHLSLQSGSDTVLKRMNRKYTSFEYEEGCKVLRKYYDRPSITTDIIVGFPGETEEEFEETMRFAERIAFSKIHVFQFSGRKGTRAYRMPDQIPEAKKHERSERLIRLEKMMREEYVKGFLGEEQNVLTEEVETIEDGKYLVGYNERYIRCAVPEGSGRANAVITGTAKAMKDEVLILASGQEG